MTRAEAMPLKVLFFGDSITKGQGVTADQRWTALVAAHSHGAFVEVNEGKPGRPAAAVGEFSKMLEEYPANSGISVLVIALGTNDSRDTSPNCVRKTAAYLSKMVTMARTREPGWKIVICAPYNINKDALKKSRSIGPIRERNLIGMGKAFKELASREGCGFIDFYGVIPPASLTVDGVHPDAAGHAAIAAFAQPALDGVVAALKKNPS
ncbi:MAG TPA: SGNH/GDSL hydrolase family protein [Chthoniobacteraceae bacterium]|nr:SGNH/GDSL hydrolase family protein [Chthoniobacteraceae bacterium]